MDNKKTFKPFIPADKVLPEFTPVSLILGIVLAVVAGYRRFLMKQHGEGKEGIYGRIVRTRTERGLSVF